MINFFNDINRFNDDNMIKNEEAVHYLKSLLSLYNYEVLGDTSIKQSIRTKLEIIKFLVNFHSVYSNNTLLSFTTLKDLKEQVYQLNINKAQYGELAYIDDLYEDARLWNEKAVSMLKSRDDKFDEIWNGVVEIVNPNQISKLEILLSILDKSWDHKPKISEIEQLIDQGREGVADFSAEISKLEQQIIKAEKWMIRAINFKELPVKTFDDLHQLTSDLAEVAVNVSEISDILQLYLKSRILKIKLDSFLRQIKDKMEIEENDCITNSPSTIRLQAGNLKEDDEENQQPQHIQNLVSFNDSQQLIKDIDSLKIDFGDSYKQFKDSLFTAQKFQYRLQDTLSGQIDFHMIKVLEKDAKIISFSLPELKLLHEKSELHKEIRSLVGRKIATPEVLKQKLQQLKENFKDSKLLQELQDKLDKANDIQSQLDVLLSKTEFTEKDLNETVPNLFSEMKTSKIDLPSKNDLVSLQKSHKWIEKLYAFYNNNTHHHPPGGEKKQDSMDIEIIKISSDNADDGDNISVMFTKLQNSQSVAPNLSKSAHQLRSLIKEGQSIDHKDIRIKNIFVQYGHILWKYDTENLIKSFQINPHELENLYELSQVFNISSTENNETYSNFKRIYEKYHIWKVKYDDLCSHNAFNRILSQNHDDDILKQKIQSLLEEYPTLQVNLEDAHTTLKNSMSWIEWSLKVNTLLDVIKNPSGKILFDSLQDLYSYGNLINVPKDSSTNESLYATYSLLKIARDRYEEFKNLKINAVEKIKQIKEQESTSKGRKKEIYDINRAKPTLSLAKEIYQLIISSQLSVDQAQLNELEKEINECEQWYSKVLQFMNENMLQITSSAENIDNISRDLNNLRSEMVSLHLQVENGDQEMYAYEWTFQALMLLNNENRKNKLGADIKDWTKMIKYAQNLKNIKIIESQFYKNIQDQINQYQIIAHEVNQIRQKEENLSNLSAKSLNMKGDAFAHMRKDLKSTEEIKNILNMIQECKVDTNEERKYLEELLTRSKKITDTYHEITNISNKSSLNLHFKLLELIKKTPLAFMLEENNLEKNVQKAKILRKGVEEIKKKGQVDLKNAESIVNQYKDCPIMISEAAQIVQNYEESMKIYKKIEFELDDKTEKTFDDVISLLKLSDDITIALDSKFDELRIRLYQIKINYISKFANQTEKLSNPLSFSFMKNTLLEGYSLLTTADAVMKLKVSIQFVENLLIDVEKNLHHIYAIKDQTLLEDINHLMHNFIDLREEIIDYKAQLSLYPNFKTNLDSVIKNVYQYEDEDKIIEACKNILSKINKPNRIAEKIQVIQINEEPKKKKR